MSLFWTVNTGKDRVVADSSLSFLEKTSGKLKSKEGLAAGYGPVIPALGWQRQKDQDSRPSMSTEFKISLGNLKSYFKRTRQKKKEEEEE